ncbi:uncharacterized protein LOC142242802 [Haematobia irritans]|uniref:uncharacterized protein LOC142242802 n=1 Tax=Haematobia irritans TaxID=7368 RepID=UPI003F507498
MDRQLWPSPQNIPDTSLESRPVQVLIVLGYILLFLAHTHPSSRKDFDHKTVNLSSTELTQAKYRLMILSQKMYFPTEYNCLSRRQTLPSNSCLLTLTPFLDKHQVIRANGRLGSTIALTYNDRHPVVLSCKSRFAQLYVEFIHRLTLHGGLQLTLATIRLECWIIRAKNLIKARINRCKECVVSRQLRQGQIMAPLPDERTIFGRHFALSGVDYAGPFDIKITQGRGCRITKGYICLFICFVTKADHLEPICELSTQAFLAAFTRFGFAKRMSA